MMRSSRKQDIAGRFSRAAASYASHAALQAAIADTLLATLQPAGVMLDAGCGRGRESAWLAAQPGVESVIALDMAPAMLAALPASSRLRPLLGDMENLPLPTASVDGVFSSFALQWAGSPATVMREMARVLKPGGRLHASVPGPGSLAALRRGGLQVNAFAPVAEWENALRRAGFEKVVCRTQDFALHFPTARDLLEALKGIGAGSTDVPRGNHLRGRDWWRQVSRELEAQREPEGLPLRYEVVFLEAHRG